MPAYTLPNQPLTERFANPPAHTRILKNNHHLPADPQEAAVLLKTYRECGFGGVVSNVSWDGNYLEDETLFNQFISGLKQARQMGMSVWLYDESWYPSGAGGGFVMRDHPELEVQGLFIATQTGDSGALILDTPPGTILLAAALPAGEDGEFSIEKAVSLKDGDLIPQEGNRLAWSAPGGNWKLVVITESVIYENTQACESIKPARRYPSLLLPEVAQRFIQSTHDAYAAHLGSDLKPWFTAMFTDEPSLMSIFYPPMPYSLLPWNRYLAYQFGVRRGYVLFPELLAMAVDPGARGKRVRCDFFRTVAELFSENYFGSLQSWCSRHGTRSGGHLLLEEPLLAHVCLYGDFFRCARRLDAPGIDVLTSIPEEVSFHSARLVSSIAEISGADVTMSESSEFAQMMAKLPPVTIEQIRGSLNRQILGGITSFNSYYSYTNITSQQQAELNEYIGRCITMLEGGRRVTDIAVLYPIESTWARYLAEPGWVSGHNSVGGFAPAARRVQDCYRGASDALILNRQDFAYIDTQALLDARVDGGKLKHGQLEWKILVLPCVDTLPLEAWKKIEQFWQAGGTVIALDTLPTNTTQEFPSAEVTALAQRMFGKPGEKTTSPNGGTGVFLPEGDDLFSRLTGAVGSILAPDVTVSPANSPIRLTRRRNPNGEVFFIMNDSSQPWEGTIQFAINGKVECWDPHSGTVKELRDGKVSLLPYGSTILRIPS